MLFPWKSYSVSQVTPLSLMVDTSAGAAQVTGLRRSAASGQHILRQACWLHQRLSLSPENLNCGPGLRDSERCRWYFIVDSWQIWYHSYPDMHQLGCREAETRRKQRKWVIREKKGSDVHSEESRGHAEETEAKEDEREREKRRTKGQTSSLPARPLTTGFSETFLDPLKMSLLIQC